MTFVQRAHGGNETDGPTLGAEFAEGGAGVGDGGQDLQIKALQTADKNFPTILCFLWLGVDVRL